MTDGRDNVTVQLGVSGVTTVGMVKVGPEYVVVPTVTVTGPVTAVGGTTAASSVELTIVTAVEATPPKSTVGATAVGSLGVGNAVVPAASMVTLVPTGPVVGDRVKSVPDADAVPTAADDSNMAKTAMVVARSLPVMTLPMS
jgi:hypothetical protein